MMWAGGTVGGGTATTWCTHTACTRCGGTGIDPMYVDTASNWDNWGYSSNVYTLPTLKQAPRYAAQWLEEYRGFAPRPTHFLGRPPVYRVRRPQQRASLMQQRQLKRRAFVHRLR